MHAQLCLSSIEAFSEAFHLKVNTFYGLSDGLAYSSGLKYRVLQKIHKFFATKPNAIMFYQLLSNLLWWLAWHASTIEPLKYRKHFHKPNNNNNELFLAYIGRYIVALTATRFGFEFSSVLGNNVVYSLVVYSLVTHYTFSSLMSRANWQPLQGSQPCSLLIRLAFRLIHSLSSIPLKASFWAQQLKA